VTATDPNSDYNTPSTDLFQNLPDPYQSDTNRSIMSNLFNRFLSKTETVHTVGYIGQGNPAAIVPRQIKEPTVHRQAYQLQPILYDKIGSVEYISSWYDILNGLTAQGVNIDDQSSWASALVFNWVPPIDINKIVNYRDYYWYDPTNPQSQPQYVTVKSECAAATALANFYGGLIAQYGTSFNIVDVIPTESAIIVGGDLTTLFASNFVFFIENSTNQNLGNTFQQVQSSSYDANTNETTIIITGTFTDSTVSGDITLETLWVNYQGIANCKCVGDQGWDIGPWDDNPSTPTIWDAQYFDTTPGNQYLIVFPTLTDWNNWKAQYSITINQYDLWWDTTNDTLYILINSALPSDINSWEAVYSGFSYLVNQISGTGYWDLSTGCSPGATITGLDQWINENKWMHKADITNFSIAKQAQIPIIEFEPNIELNEWTYTTYQWMYRANNTVPFTNTNAQPTRLELEPINLYVPTSSNQIIVDERFGDLTNVFVPGYKFLINTVAGEFTVVSSQFKRSSTTSGAAFNTVVTVQENLPTLTQSVNYLQPALTSQGDAFTSYGDQWLFVGKNTTLAVNHQPLQTMITPSSTAYATTSSYIANVAPYAEQFTITQSNVVTTLNLDNYSGPGSTRPLTQRALYGNDDIRVYLNGVRQYGTYDELPTTNPVSNTVDTTYNNPQYVIGIQFFQPLQEKDVVLIEVGEPSYQDFGNYAVPVRTILDDTLFLNQGTPLFQYVSLVQYRVHEQVKTELNQYPLFDMYNVNSTTNNTATPIFGYQYEAPSGTIYPYAGQRIATAADGSLMFQNYLVESNNGVMLAYRNYNKSAHQYWYNPLTNNVLVWTGETWATRFENASGLLDSVYVLSELPTTNLYDGQIVFNTTSNTLNEWNVGTNSWILLTDIIISTSDETLETNWRRGLYNENFIPAQVDWQRRSYTTYEQQYNNYITQTADQLMLSDPSLTLAEAEAQANTQWTTIQDRFINPEWYTDTTTPSPVRNGPLWVGNWQIPDPLYFNPGHEDWQFISATDLLTHFTTIVGAQPSLPGFGGLASANWRLLDYTQIDWALGGTIKEYDNSFDTFLSSQFVNNVTPPSLFSFAQSEYENAIIQLRDLLTRNFVTYLTNTDPSVIQNISSYAASQVLTLYEENEAQNLIYGDSTTFNPVTNTGVENWIATLPFFGIIPKVTPYIYRDKSLNIFGIMHHDGHRQTYVLPNITVLSLQRDVVNTPDPRVSGENFGRISTLQPPATQSQFISQFSPTPRNGVYWLQGNTLYRLQVANVGSTPPANTVVDGSLWWDTGTSTLRQQTTIGSTIEWNPAPGITQGDGRLFNGLTIQSSTISAWQIVDFNEIYLQTVLNVEQDLYQVAPIPPPTPPVNFDALMNANQTQWDQYLYQQFINYTIDLQIASPFVNDTYNASDPFTWNYKYSSTLLPPKSNSSIVSGGAWQDVYQKAYGTPYPHLEPWMLQGYKQQPSWWNGLYLNDNPTVFGTRRWKYIHKLPVTYDILTGIFSFAGNMVDAFTGFNKFTLYYSDNINNQVFTIASVSYSTLTNTTNITTVGVPLQTTTGAVVNVGMWDYILRGDIPVNPVTGAQYLMPTGATSIPTYNYMSVNISQETFADGIRIYSPDSLFAPYWNNSTYYSSPVAIADLPVRSMFTNLNEIELENANYKWLDAGPIEWQWRQTSNYLYSLLTVAYLLDPVRTIQNTFGIDFAYINGLPIDLLSGKVFSHTSTQFHGETTNTNQLIQVNGINQWYVNFNRASGIDTSYSDFRTLWTGWIAPLSYQFGAFIDTSSLSVEHRVVSITPTDYNITMKRSPGVANSWIDALNVEITYVPPDLNLYDTENQWALQVKSQAPVARTISYYDVQLYDYYIDPTTSICYLYTYPIAGVSTTQNSFLVNGDVTQVFGGLNGASQLQVTGSNTGTYTVNATSYDPVQKTTTIIVNETIPLNTSNGLVSAINYKTIPWSSGDIVLPTSTELLPLPLEDGKQYFIIVLSPTTFQLAYTSTDVTANIPILFTTKALGIQRVGQLYNTFLALNGAHTSTVWYHYQPDTTSINQLQLPSQIVGMQSFINLVDGYSSYISAQGFGINVNGQYTDPLTGQQVSWQNELERFIDWAYQQRTIRRNNLVDKYPVDVNYSTSQLTYTSQNPGFINGQAVVVWAIGGGLPPPLKIGQIYYVIVNSNGTISLASNYTNATSGTPITLTPTNGIGTIYVAQQQQYAASLPSYELNPFRNALWYSPQYGILSNIVTGPFQDVYSTQVIFDQYGRRLSAGDIRVFRQDKITQIQFASGVYNDVNAMQNLLQNPYLYLHIGGANLYVDTYEHIMQFNDYTTAGALLYDPFIGLNVTKYEMDFYKQDTFTERPNVGGYFLSQPYNQGATLLRNIEGTLEDLRYMYDPYQIPETLPAVQYSRAVIGYPGIQNYLSQINLTPKSQFLFWKGTIHNKGSRNMITAFINSRRFVNANVDDFWAYKVADFGPTRLPEYLNMWLQINDTVSNDLRLEFILNDQLCLPGYQEETFGNTECGYANPPNSSIVITGVDPTFTAISMTDETRWYNQPDVLQQLVPDGGVLYFDLEPKQKLVVYPITLTSGSGFNPLIPSQLTDTTSPLYAANLTTETAVICYDPSNNILTSSGLTIAHQQNYYTFWIWNGTEFVFSGGWDGITTTPYLRHNFKADTVTATMSIWPEGTESTYVVPASPSTSQLELIIPYLPLTNSLTVFNNGVQLQVGVDYVESLELYSGSQILGYKLYFANPISGSTIKVVYGPSQLNLDTQFQIVNTNILGLLSQEFIKGTTGNSSLDVGIFNTGYPITLWGLEVNKEALNPAEIIDEQAKVVVTPVPYWDPARGYYYYEALNSIDILSNSDPAVYDTANGGLSGWKEQKVGTVWFDTTNAKYLPYYDPYVLQNFEDRFADWGQLADYGDVHVYEWTASQYPPDQYNAIAAVQEGNSSIDPSIRLSGTVKQDLQYINRTSTDITVTPATSGYTTIVASGNTGPIFTTDPTNFNATTSYGFTITVDSNTRTLQYLGAQIPTFGDLINVLSKQFAVYGATIAIVNNSIIVTSNSVGSSSIIDIPAASDTLFTALPGYVSTTSTNGTDQQLTASNTSGFAVGDTVLFYSTGTLPTGLSESTVYTISSISGNAVDIESVTITGPGSGIITMGSSVWPTSWTTAIQQSINLDPLIDGTLSGTTYTFDESVTEFAGQTVNVYVNGKQVQTGYTIIGPLVFPTTNTFPTLNAYDRVTLIVPVPTPTSAQLSFDPTVSDNGSINTQYQYVTEYVSSQSFNESTNSVDTTYYYWVENKTTAVGTRLTTSETVSEILTPPAPYMFFGKLISPALTVNTETGQTIEMPWRFTQAIVRGLRGYVDSENRYVLRFIRDFTLRDSREFENTGLQLKDAHQEWVMFRQNQLNNIPLSLWNNVTEAMAGYLLSDPTTRVPSLNRQLYDAAYGTSTQYGMGVGQAFCNGQTAINTITAYLNDPSNNFYPIDLDLFFATYNFNTPVNCIAAMNYIYANFDYQHVNAMFFDVLLDALSVQKEYAGIMKTSAIALYGIELLDVQGIFDN
jgi:hypothetical protein